MSQPLSAREPLAALRMSLADAGPARAVPGTLARFGFGEAAVPATLPGTPLHVQLPLPPLQTQMMHELWQVDAPVERGIDGVIHWARGGGWLCAAMELDETAHGGIEQTASVAYAALARFQAAQPERHVLRIWNYFADINSGEGDDERYRRFCTGRARGLGPAFTGGYPAATAIGHRDAARGLIVYWLASILPGERVENPRQVPAWCYPRQYGPTPPGFARGMRLPNGALAISGTASIVGHESRHDGDFAAQLSESLANIESLQQAAGLAPGFAAHTPLKAYLRHAGDLPALRDALPAGVPVQALLGDVCRRELLVEIEGWQLT